MIPPLLRRLFSASRAVTGETEKAMTNPGWDEAVSRILIARLSPLRDMDRASAHLVLFAETRSALPGAFIDFAFFPDRADRELLGRAGGDTPAMPWFFGAASGRSPADFDLVFISNAFGLELVNLPRLLSTAGLPLRASERARSDASVPILALGGSNAGQAAAIVEAGGDSLVDGFFSGEGEGAIGPLAAILADTSRSRAARLAAAASIEGFWPALRPDLRARRRTLRGSPPPLLSWPPLDTPEAKTARLQITAGCPGYCSFCFEGWDRRPYREAPLEAVLDAARALRARNAVETLEVYSFNFNTYADIFELLFELGRIFRNVSLMSQRLDILADTPGLVDAELAAGKRSFTLGVEGISRRMRSYFRKGLDDPALDRLVELLVVPKLRELKLFYILSGFEDEGDLAEFAAFASRLAGRRKDSAPGLRILASAGYLVRLPGTPLGHAPLVLEEAPLAATAERLGRICEEAGIEWRLAVHFDEYCVDQLVSLAGGGLLPWFEALAKADDEAVYDGNLSRRIWPSLRTFARSRGILGPTFLGEKGPEATPRFPFLEAGTENEVLYREYLAARDFVDRPTCLGARCSDCGACPDAESRAFLVRHRIAPQPAGGTARLERLAAAKRDFVSVPVSVARPTSLAGASIQAQEAWLMRELCSASPDAWRALFGVRLLAPLPDSDFGVAPGSTGWAIFALEGPSAAAIRTLARASDFAEPIDAASLSRSTFAAAAAEAAEVPERLSVSLDIPEGLAELASAFGSAIQDGSDEELARRLLVEWLAESRVAATEVAEGKGRSFEIARRDIAKNIVHSAHARGRTIELVIGSKARLERLGSGLDSRLAGLVASCVRLSVPSPLPARDSARASGPSAGRGSDDEGAVKGRTQSSRS